jgi:TonB family protein
MSKPASSLLAILASILVLPAAKAADEPAVQGEGPALPYLRAVHGKVHPLWAGNFLLLAASQLPKEHPINVASRRAELEVVLSAKGALLDVKVAKSSGASEFDASAVEVVRAAGEFVPAPETALSDDGKVHLLWAFARDDRRCSALTVTHRELPLTEAVRNLVAQGRDDAAIARLRAADEAERMAGLDAFARAWLERNENGKDFIDVQVALVNALDGDSRGVERLRKAVAMAAVSEDVPKMGARGLAALKLPSCPLIKVAFGKTATGKKEAPAAPPTEMTDEEFLREFQGKGKSGRVLRLLDEGADGVCFALAIATAKNRAANRDDRTAALECLAHSEGPEVLAVLRALAKDPDPAIQALAIAGEARPGAGKGGVFRLTPFLRDKSLVVRTAAAAGLVRVGGEEVLPQLFLVYKEKDSKIYAALAAELGKLSGPASAEMLGRFLKKDSPEIRLAAARALAARRDEHAAKLQATLAAADRPELQLLSGLALGKEKRDEAMRALADTGLTESYSALLRGRARIVAADWLLASFSRSSPASRVEDLGGWLATRPKAP